MSVRRWLTAGVAAAALLTAGMAPAAQADSISNGPIFAVMNTSETPPDGVWFRWDAHTANTDRVTGHGVYWGERVQLRCYSWGDAVGAYGNTLWYDVLNVTRPTNAGVENSGFINAHYINDGLAANQVDAGVPNCSAPAVAPTVTLAQGPSAPAGYRYAITLDHFAATSSVSVTCSDSASPSGFYTFRLGTDGAGHAFTQSYCYSADGPEHWVVAAGVQSNHLSWGTSSSGGGGGSGGGGTGGGGGSSASCVPPKDAGQSGTYPFNNMPRRPRTNAHRKTDVKLVALAQAGILAKAGPVSFKMLQHYLGASGAQYTIDINTLMLNQPPLRASLVHYLRGNAATAYTHLSQTPADGCASTAISSGWVGYVVTDRGDWYYALRSFGYQLAGTMWIGPTRSDGTRQIKVVYKGLVADTYNFNSDDKKFGQFEQLAKDGWAADYRVVGGTLTFTSNMTTQNFDVQSLNIPLP
jgi:uncharacterized membrane protein YgcG